MYYSHTCSANGTLQYRSLQPSLDQIPQSGTTPSRIPLTQPPAQTKKQIRRRTKLALTFSVSINTEYQILITYNYVERTTTSTFCFNAQNGDCSIKFLSYSLFNAHGTGGRLCGCTQRRGQRPTPHRQLGAPLAPPSKNHSSPGRRHHCTLLVSDVQLLLLRSGSCATQVEISPRLSSIDFSLERSLTNNTRQIQDLSNLCSRQFTFCDVFCFRFPSASYITKVVCD